MNEFTEEYRVVFGAHKCFVKSENTARSVGWHLC